MKEIRRDIYLNQLIERRENGLIKVVTGIRRYGKSYLLFHLFRRYLEASGVDPSRIVTLALDDADSVELRDPQRLSAWLKTKISGHGMWYVLLDEVQFCPCFEGVLNGLNRQENVDVYVTGSNSRFLSTDVLTEFRGRGDEVRVYPLCFAEFLSAYSGSREDAWMDYCTYGGLPLILSRPSEALKSQYLIGLCRELYLKDIAERNQLRGDAVMEALVRILASSIGSLTNPVKLANTFQSNGMAISNKTIGLYIAYLEDAFFLHRAERYDVKGKKFIASPFKYYFTDVGLRNAQLNFRQQEETHLMENILFNELLVRGYRPDVGIVVHQELNDAGKSLRRYYEIDFVCNRGSQRCYIQSAFAVPDREKMMQEQRPLLLIRDSFKKIIIVKDRVKPWVNEEGILVMGLMDFLLNPDCLNL